MNSTNDRRNFKADFDRLVTDLKKASPSASMDTTSKPVSAVTSKRPAMRFHEAEDAGDARFVQHWDKAIDALLAGTDESEAIKSDSFGAIKEFIKLETSPKSGKPELIDSITTTIHPNHCIQTKSALPDVASNKGMNVESQSEPSYDTDRGDENDVLSTASTDREEEEQDPNNIIDENELDRMLNQVKVFKESLGTQDAVLLQVLQSGPTQNKGGKPYHLYPIVAAICVLLLSILVAFKLSGS